MYKENTAANISSDRPHHSGETQRRRTLRETRDLCRWGHASALALGIGHFSVFGSGPLGARPRTCCSARGAWRWTGRATSSSRTGPNTASSSLPRRGRWCGPLGGRAAARESCSTHAAWRWTGLSICLRRRLRQPPHGGLVRGGGGGADLWAGSGAGELKSLDGVAVDGAGNVFVADSGNDRIVVLRGGGGGAGLWAAGQRLGQAFSITGFTFRDSHVLVHKTWRTKMRRSDLHIATRHAAH